MRIVHSLANFLVLGVFGSLQHDSWTCTRLVVVSSSQNGTDGRLFGEYERVPHVLHCGRFIWERSWDSSGGTYHFGSAAMLYSQCDGKAGRSPRWVLAERLSQGARVWAEALDAAAEHWPRNAAWRMSGHAPLRPALAPRTRCAERARPAPKLPARAVRGEEPEHAARAGEHAACARLHHAMTLHVPVTMPNAFAEITLEIVHGTNVTAAAASFCRHWAPPAPAWQADCVAQLQREVALRRGALGAMWAPHAVERAGFHRSWAMASLVDALAAHVQLFIESGAFLGFTLRYVARRYPALTLLSCEPDDAHYAVAACNVAPWARRDGGRWQPARSVQLFHETSQAFMQRLERQHPGRVVLNSALVFLDAHGYGFEWPLQQEVRYYTRKFRGGFLLIDDFRVPAAGGGAAFGYDSYDGQECSLEFIAPHLPPQSEVPWRLYYPRTAHAMLGDETHNVSLDAVYSTLTAAEPASGPCTDAGACTLPAAGAKPATEEPRGWGLIAFGTHAHLRVDLWLPHLARRHSLSQGE
eukprot:g862.t1